MARFYNVTIGPSPSGNQGAVFTNMVNGAPDPGAQLVELDIQLAPFAEPYGGSFVRIWGVSLQQISQASDFNGAQITVSAGMQKGLPLATADVEANQRGVLVEGLVQAAFGNWLGVNQTLDLVLIADGGATQATPANIAPLWKKGTTLASAIQSAMAAAYPTYTAQIEISSNLILPQDVAGYYQTIEQFAQFVKTTSQSILTTDYPGVDIVLDGTTFKVFDASTVTAPIQIAFQDLIGQPTWLSPNTIQFNTVMRADIAIGDFIQFPTLSTLQTATTQQSTSQYRDKSTFQGVFNISSVRHVGNSRAPNAQSWISSFQCYAAGSSDATNSPANTSA